MMHAKQVNINSLQDKMHISCRTSLGSVAQLGLTKEEQFPGRLDKMQGSRLGQGRAKGVIFVWLSRQIFKERHI